MYGEVTVGIPDATDFGFASTPIAPVVLRQSVAGTPLCSVSWLGYDTPQTPTILGSTPITGNAYAPKAVLALAPLLTPDERSRLYALATWQKSTRNPLRLVDEINQRTVIATYNPRPLINPITPSWGADVRIGYAAYSVQLTLSDSDYVGTWTATGQQAVTMTFSAVEL